nr:PREDICTED: gem-associated protein 5-like [Paralichthys olivaceus]
MPAQTAERVQIFSMWENIRSLHRNPPNQAGGGRGWGAAGFEAWSRAVEAFIKQLCLQEQYLKAASHLLSINKVYEAVDLLRSNKLYREAIALVKARLPADDPTLKELYTCWAAVLEKDGHFSSAAKCYLAAGASFDAAKVIARKNDVSSLKTAASLAKISGEVALAQSLALRCAKDLAAAQNWVGAQDVLSSHETLLVHQLHFSVTELLSAMLEDAGVIPQPCTSGHAWSSPDEGHTSIQDRVRDVWETQFGVSQTSAGRHGAGTLLQELKSVESPTLGANVPLRQVLLYSSLHLTHSVLSWLLDDDEQLIKGLWQAVAWLRDAGHFCVSAELCRRLFPDDDVTVYSRKRPKTLHLSEEGGRAAADSLQAFVHYHRLYDRWWSNSAHDQKVHNGHSLPATDFRAGDEPEDKVVNGESSESGKSVHSPTGSLDDLGFDASLLLSESHAACQATQRSVREIQEQLAAMVQQHSRAQGGQLETGETQADTQTSSAAESSDGHGSTDAEKRPDDHQTLLSLSLKMSELQKELADLPDTLKAFPHPDVLECCLVLLHLSESSPPVSESLRRDARDLLRKHGSGPSVLRASQRFLT